MQLGMAFQNAEKVAGFDCGMLPAVAKEKHPSGILFGDG
jgi:hypothetical protein